MFDLHAHTQSSNGNEGGLYGIPKAPIKVTN